MFFKTWENQPYSGRVQTVVAQDFSYQPVQNSEAPTPQPRPWRQRSLSGWKGQMILFTVASSAVFAANIYVSVFATRRQSTYTTDFSPIYTGNCNRGKTLNTVVHLAINVLSSILLAASNFSIQVLSAPTRKQIDTSHAKRRWLDIGIPSVRNLRFSSRGSIAMCIFIFVSSVPLHLMYNSILSLSWTRQAYDAILVTPGFMDGAPFSVAGADERTQLFSEIQANSTRYERLDQRECIELYRKKAILDRKTVLVVTSDEEWQPGNSVLAYEEYVGNAVEIGTWFCPDDNIDDWGFISGSDCDIDAVLSGSEKWTPFASNVTVDYCLSEYLGEQCTLDFSLGLMIVVCICITVKVLCMTVLCFQTRPEIILTIGDAIASFLNRRDPNTAGMCLFGRYHLEKSWRNTQRSVIPTVWNAERSRWHRAVSLKRWVATIGLCLITIILALGLLVVGMTNERVRNADLTMTDLWNSFGVASIEDESTFAITLGSELYQPHLLTKNILLANLPQLILSYLYFQYNSALTSIVTAKEWDSYSKIRKSLRVTAPVGQQRSTYYLQLPFRYSIPLIITSILLHWLTSQAIFLDRRIVRQVWWGEPYTDNQVGSVNIVGYSPIAVIFCLLVGLILILALLWIGYRKFTPGMPIAGNNSAAISAACHPPADDVDASIVPVMWGAIPTPSAYWKDGSGHCSFTSFWVESPVQGCQYL